MLINIIIY